MQLNVKELMKGANVFLFDQITLSNKQTIGPLQIWGISASHHYATSLKTPANPVKGDVRELDDKPRINQILIENTSSLPLFIPEGWFLNSEHLLQSRVLVNDVFIEPFQNQFVSVACIESNRWSQSSSMKFEQGRVPPSVIATMRSVDVSQGNIDGIRFRQERTWNRISTLASRGTPSPTNSLIEIMEGLSRKSERNFEITDFWANESGVVLALDGHPLLLEIFDSPATLTMQIGHLIEATLIDSTLESSDLVSDSRIEKFLEEVLKTPLKLNTTRNSNEIFSAKTANLSSRMSRAEGIPFHALSINMKHPAFN